MRFLSVLLLITMATRAQTVDLARYPVYGGKDLGLTYRPSHSMFRIWAPTAEKAELRLYATGTGGRVLSVVDMKKAEAGTWTASVGGDQKGKYYAFRVQINGQWGNEVPDPYARLLGTNGKRGMIGDLASSNPAG